MWRLEWRTLHVHVQNVGNGRGKSLSQWTQTPTCAWTLRGGRAFCLLYQLYCVQCLPQVLGYLASSGPQAAHIAVRPPESLRMGVEVSAVGYAG